MQSRGYAVVAQLVERHLAKVEVASSSLVGRSRGCTGFDGGMEAGIASGCAYHPKNGQLIN